MTTLTTVHLAPVAMPRGAIWAADAVVSVYRWATALRARWAERQAGRFSDAEALRQYAMQFINSDPGLAADLFAAADRHRG
jgi:cob(I)alamin adenosyltransferase